MSAAAGGLVDRDRWWLSQFDRLLTLEDQGAPPRSLEKRWLMLASRTWGNRRWSVSFQMPNYMHHVLGDADVRAKDQRYAANQRSRAREWLNA